MCRLSAQSTSSSSSSSPSSSSSSTSSTNMRIFSLFLFFSSFLVPGTTSSSSSSTDSPIYKKCEKQLGSMFTKAEKVTICARESSSSSSSSSSSPHLSLYSLCASEVRKEFKLSFDDIAMVCQDSQSLSHLSCLREMKPTERGSYG